VRKNESVIQVSSGEKIIRFAPHNEIIFIFHFQVLLRCQWITTYHSTLYGGTIIGKRHILTTAHCLRKSDITFNDLPVEATIERPDKPKIYQPGNVIVHEKFDIYYNYADIAVVEFKGTVAREF
jgi:secreted trypsin-like serine protease